MSVNEPATVLTDYVVAGFAMVFLVRLLRNYRETRSFTVLFWSLAFASVVVSAAIGGTYHGTQGWWKPSVQDALWHATLVATLAISFLLLVAVIFSSLDGKWRTSSVSVNLILMSMIIDVRIHRRATDSLAFFVEDPVEVTLTHGDLRPGSPSS